MSSDRRPELLTAVLTALREQSGRGLMLHGAIAERFGLNFTDLKCLDLARAEPQLTAGRIAEAIGLSTSAVTTVLDRLEQRGFIDRRRDPTDRRKVVVVSTGRHEEKLGEIFTRVGEGVIAILGDYSDEQLDFLAEVIQRLNDEAKKEVVQITSAGSAVDADG